MECFPRQLVVGEEEGAMQRMRPEIEIDDALPDFNVDSASKRQHVQSSAEKM